ncbi:MotA/TolQ/ExbB proton channel family protein [bacterium]|nr:MotA/TolQ/ExbB proton channel family protein [bacterium]
MEQLMNMVEHLWLWLEKGGLVMVPLLLCSVIGLAIVLVKLVQLRHHKIIIPEIVQIIKSFAGPADAEMALRVCRDKKGPFATIIKLGLENRDLPADGIREIIEDQGRQETRALEQGLITLETIAAIAPLLGLLGTVLGMVDVFNEIASAASVQVNQLSTGISKALITTIVGLSIGIPALVAYNYLLNRVESLVLDIEKHAAILFHKLRRLSETPVNGDIQE